VDLGHLESGQKSQELLLTVTPTGEAKWDDLSVLDCSYLSDKKIVKQSPGQFAVYARVSTLDVPLGRFTGTIPLRFKFHGKPVLGGLNVPFTVTVIGDVAAIPPLILLKTGPSSTQSSRFQITSKKRQPITLLSYQAAPGVTVQSSLAAKDPLELTVSFDPYKASPSVLASGSLLLHVKTDKEWVLRIPYITGN
jgi:hypothetical protein